MKRTFALSIVLILGLFQRSSPGRQSDFPQAKGQASLQHDVSVVRKLVQVYVTDKKGNPIADLQKDDFILYDNKDEKQITEFERHALSLPGTAAPAPAAEPAAAAIEPPPPLLNRKFSMLFDLVFTRAKGFRIAKNAALQFLDSGLTPTDEASVLLFSRTKSSTSAGFRRATTLRFARPSNPWTSRTSWIGSSMRARSSGPRFSPARTLRCRISGRVRAAVLRRSGSWPESFITGLEILRPGPSLPTRAKAASFFIRRASPPATLGRGQAGGAYSEAQPRVRRACTRKLAAAGISVFPVNTADPDAFKVQFGTGETTLRETAASTGGRYLRSSRSPPRNAMETLNSITGMYYVLGYPIGQTWDGKFHTIRVKVSRPDCEGSHARPELLQSRAVRRLFQGWRRRSTSSIWP
ncbi:MAG: hypothetical protein MZV64_52735 [Ignavibacteriales bacterium]|nr:hypothetical protein [Ignavibacteriales bacterium]